MGGRISSKARRDTEQLCDAAGHGGSAEAVRACLARGIDPDQVATGRDSPLCHAAMYGHDESVRLLVEAGANVRHAGSYGRTPLHYARSAEIATYLLDHGADLASRHVGGDDALLDLITTRDDATIARVLLERGLVVTRCPKSHLAWAAFCKRKEIVKTLLAHGVSPDELDHEGYAVIFQALSGEPPEGHDIAMILIEAGASVDVRDRWGTTLLERVCGRHDPGLVAMVLGRIELPRTKGQHDGRTTPLMAAAHAGSLKIVTLLIEGGVPLDDVDGAGGTALMAAARAGRREVVELLLRSGAIPTVSDGKGNTALHHAAYTSEVALFDRLVEAGCRPDVPNALGWTPFLIACEQNHLALVHALIDRGADVNQRLETTQATPLLIASAAGADAVVTLLLEHGADASARGNDGKTAEDHARERMEAARADWEGR